MVSTHDGKIQMVRPHFQREGAKKFENQEIALTQHSKEEIEILRAHQEEKQHIDNCSRRKNARQTSTRPTTQHLVYGHQGVDREVGRGMH